MKKRLNDTAAVVGMNPYETQSEHYSRTVRKIDNGYITRHSHYGPNCPDGPGEKEVFTEGHPDAAAGSSAIGPSTDSMKRAVEFMSKK